jgi:hypothetical protein
MGSLPSQVTGHHLLMMETYEPIDPQEANYKEMSEPIPLTEDWLIRFGFEKLPGGNIVNCSLPYWAKDALLLFFNESPPYNTYLIGYGFNIADQYYAATHRWINSVHELQNVYKEYRNSELTLKEKL